MLIDDYRRRVAATVIQLAQDDPILVREVIGRLRAAGEIEADDLVYLDRIAERWIAISRFFARTDLMRSFLPAFFLHIAYIAGLGAASLFARRYEWKGRRVH